MPEIVVDGVRLHYETRGPADAPGPPWLLLHHFLGTGLTSWRAQIAAWSHRHRLVIPDQPGHGRSTTFVPDLTHRRAAALFRGFVDQLGLDDFCLVGHSLGAVTGMFWAVQGEPRVRAMAWLGVHWFDVPDPLAVAAVERYCTEGVTHGARAQLAELHRPGGPDRWAQLLATFRRFPSQPPDQAYPSAAELARIRVPVLIVQGDRDEFVGPLQTARLHSLVPGARLCILPGAGHLLQVGARQLVNQVVEAFLDQATGQEPARR